MTFANWAELVGTLTILFLCIIGGLSVLNTVLAEHFIPTCRGIHKSLRQMYPARREQEAQ